MLKRTIIILITLLASMSHSDGIPTGSMTPSSIGIEYTGFMAGQTITKATVSSHLNAHFLTLRYSPLQYLLVSFGIGGTRFATAEYDSSRFTGKTGASVSGGIGLYSPCFFNFLKITGGLEGYLLNSSEGTYKYTGGVANPFFGLIVLIGNMVDIQAGLRGHIMSGTMKSPAASGLVFSNTNYPRGYGSVTLHAPGGGAYATLGFDASRAFSTEWSDGPEEATLSLQIGFIIKDIQSGLPGSRDNKGKRTDNYDKMKAKQDKMAEEMKK